MIAQFETVLLLLAVLAGVAVLSRRLGIAPSILLVVAGVALAFVPGLPAIQLAPELVLLVILPPLIYSAGVAMSWREFRFNLRPIALLAVGCVVFTACAVAVAVHWFLGMPWAVAFALGAIVAPPDVVAPLAIARRLGLPRRLLVVLEGEGVANDATALILYRFAVAAAVTGSFSLGKAGLTFAAIVVGEIAFGILVGWVSLRLRQWARDPRVEITLSLMTPYVAFWAPEHLGGSGVLATMVCGLYISWNGPLLIPSATRLQGIFFWDLTIYLIEGFVFLLTGLQARALVERSASLSWRDPLIATAITTAIVIVARFLWVFPAAYLPRWLSPSLARRDPVPSWQFLFALGFTGVRGVVSLAAALALPLTIGTGEPFPYRDLILFITFGVIIFTLVGQGMMLPSVARWLRLTEHAGEERRREREQEAAVRRDAQAEADRLLEALAARRNLPDSVVHVLRAREEMHSEHIPPLTESGIEIARLSADVRLELIGRERAYIHEALRAGRITDEARRRIERELDLEEASLGCVKDDRPRLPLA